MDFRTRRLARWLRLLVACLAFVTLRPAPAVASTKAEIVLVAAAREVHEPRVEESEACLPVDRAARAPRSFEETERLVALQSPRALASRLYLRNCSLLR